MWHWAPLQIFLCMQKVWFKVWCGQCILGQSCHWISVLKVVFFLGSFCSACALSALVSGPTCQEFWKWSSRQLTEKLFLKVGCFICKERRIISWVVLVFSFSLFIHILLKCLKDCFHWHSCDGKFFTYVCWFGLEGFLKITQFQYPCHGQDYFSLDRTAAGPSNLALDTSREGTSVTSLVNLVKYNLLIKHIYLDNLDHYGSVTGSRFSYRSSYGISVWIC